MSKHTPGPWIDTRHRKVIARANSGELTTVCEVFSGSVDTLEEADANQSLIAAAPELLESLTNLVGLARAGAAQLGKYHAALAAADVAIAKAGGGA